MEGSLGRVKDLYPKYNETLHRCERMEERPSGMIVTGLGQRGHRLPGLFDQVSRELQEVSGTTAS